MNKHRKYTEQCSISTTVSVYNAERYGSNGMIHHLITIQVLALFCGVPKPHRPQLNLHNGPRTSSAHLGHSRESSITCTHLSPCIS